MNRQFQFNFFVAITFSLFSCVDSAAQTKEHELRQLPVGEVLDDDKRIIGFIEELQKDIMRWRNGIEFAGTFVQRDSGYGHTRDAALAAVDISTEESRSNETTIVATGLFAKKGSAFRYRRDSKTVLHIVHQVDGATVSGLFSRDVNSARGIEFQYKPKQPTNDGGKNGGAVYFGKFDYLPKEALTTRKFHYFPFEVMGGNHGYPFIIAPRPTSLDYRFKNTDSGFQITITNIRNSDREEDYRLESTYDFRDTPNGPLLVRRSHLGDDWAETRLLDFVDCGDGYLFPRAMVEVHGNKDSEARAISWYSEDVGQRLPETSDFDVEIPAGTRWHGYDPNGEDQHWQSENKAVVKLNVLEIDTDAIRSSYKPRKPGQR